ncbi:hypothetical protein BD770DRAFT_469082 [Pilaira anomala]|nr:hypothetical protein BD770DRAFT_469082 [Pilaira anomala]
MSNYYSFDSIRFPPGTISSKLSNNKMMMKQPAAATDWVHQTYMEMIQDVSYATSHYYESKKNIANMMDCSSLVKDNLHTNKKPDEIRTKVETGTRNHCSPLSIHEYHISDNNSSNNDDEEVIEEDDDESIFCQTITTSSTDCNRKNNIYRFYKEQQKLAAPIEEEIIPVPYIQPNNNNNLISSDDTRVPSKVNKPPPQQKQQQQQQQQQQENPKKFRRKLKRMMTKMKMAAENPFWAIDNRFQK